MPALTVTVCPAPYGWAVYLSDGRALARYYGPGSRWRALRYASGLGH